MCEVRCIFFSSRSLSLTHTQTFFPLQTTENAKSKIAAISGSQADFKGVYPTGSMYFNPPGSGHSVWNSTGFFLLTYAAPPDFVNTDLIDETYTPVIINTSDEEDGGNITETTTTMENKENVPYTMYEIPLDPLGGMSAAFYEIPDGSSPLLPVTYEGHFVLVLRGSCVIGPAEEIFGEQMLIVAKQVQSKETFVITNEDGNDCMVMGVAFTTTKDEDPPVDEDRVSDELPEEEEVDGDTDADSSTTSSSAHALFGKKRLYYAILAVSAVVGVITILI